MPAHAQHRCKFQESGLEIGVVVLTCSPWRPTQGKQERKATLSLFIFKDDFIFEVMDVSMSVWGNVQGSALGQGSQKRM